MVYDLISNIGKYQGLSENLDRAVLFILNTDLSALPLGRTDIWEDRVFANVMEAEAKDKSEGTYEIHKKYMDIQIDLEGCEAVMIGLGEGKALKPYEEATDFGTVLVDQSAVCVLGSGRFILCMAEEAHKPGVAVTENRVLKKCVIKVRKED